MTDLPRPEDELPPPIVDPTEDAVVTAPTETPTPSIPESRMRWGLVGFLVLVILFMIVALQNSQTTELHFLVWETPEMPLSVIILGTAAVAVVVDELFGFVWRFRRRRRRKKLEKALK